MNTLPNRQKKDQKQLLKLSKRKTHNSSLAIERSKEKLGNTTKDISELKFDGL